jgi:hypothetical protein
MPGQIFSFSMTKYKVISEPIHVEEENRTHLDTDVYPCNGHKQTETADDFDDGKSDFMRSLLSSTDSGRNPAESGQFLEFQRN